MCDLNQSIKIQVANTVRSLLDRKSSEGLDAFRFFSTQVNLLSNYKGHVRTVDVRYYVYYYYCAVLLLYCIVPYIKYVP